MANAQRQTTTVVETQPVKQKNESSRKIGILGGTFNPIHLGHLIIADQVLNQLGLEQIRFMPDATPPHVDKKLAIPAADRVAMVNRAIADNPQFCIEMAEVIRGGISYTVDTMRALHQAHPETEYYFIIGGDMVEYLPKWNRIDELVNLVHFVGIKRHGYEQTSPYPIIWVDVPFVDISSTLIRSKIKQHQSINYLVPTAVEQYIKEHQLYE